MEIDFFVFIWNYEKYFVVLWYQNLNIYNHGNTKNVAQYIQDVFKALGFSINISDVDFQSNSFGDYALFLEYKEQGFIEAEIQTKDNFNSFYSVCFDIHYCLPDLNITLRKNFITFYLPISKVEIVCQNVNNFNIFDFINKSLALLELIKKKQVTKDMNQSEIEIICSNLGISYRLNKKENTIEFFKIIE